MRALAIVDSFDKPQRKVDFNVVRSNLKYCPNVMSLLGQRWFDDKINAQDSSHPLISLLSLPEPDMEKVRRLADEFTKSKGDRMRQASLTHSLAWELEPLATIEHIDRAVAHILKDKNPKTSRLKSGIDNPDEYYPTVGELLISAHFKAVWPTDIQYKVGERPVDCMVNVDGTEILVEVISLDMPVELKYVRTVIGLANRAREKIEEKLEKQIPAMAKVSDRPIFLAMNRTRGLDIDEIMVTDALYGTMQFTFVVNKEKKGEPAGGYPSRANDSISLTEEGRQISGIILFKTDFDLADCKVKLYGDIYRNVNSDRPVSNDLIEKMKAALFNRTLA
jgi:hypothetical protein